MVEGRKKEEVLKADRVEMRGPGGERILQYRYAKAGKLRQETGPVVATEQVDAMVEGRKKEEVLKADRVEMRDPGEDSPVSIC